MCVLGVVGPDVGLSVASHPFANWLSRIQLLVLAWLPVTRTLGSGRSIADCSNSAQRQCIQGISIPDFL